MVELGINDSHSLSSAAQLVVDGCRRLVLTALRVRGNSDSQKLPARQQRAVSQHTESHGIYFAR